MQRSGEEMRASEKKRKWCSAKRKHGELGGKIHESSDKVELENQKES